MINNKKTKKNLPNFRTCLGWRVAQFEVQAQHPSHKKNPNLFLVSPSAITSSHQEKKP